MFSSSDCLSADGSRVGIGEVGSRGMSGRKRKIVDYKVFLVVRYFIFQPSGRTLQYEIAYVIFDMH